MTETEKSDLGGPDRQFQTSYVYDGLDRLVRMTDSSGNITERAYDSRNNVGRIVDPLRSPRAPGGLGEHHDVRLRRPQSPLDQLPAANRHGAGGRNSRRGHNQQPDVGRRLAAGPGVRRERPLHELHVRRGGRVKAHRLRRRHLRAAAVRHPRQPRQGHRCQRPRSLSRRSTLSTA